MLAMGWPFPWMQGQSTLGLFILGTTTIARRLFPRDIFFDFPCYRYRLFSWEWLELRLEAALGSKLELR
jgi:hypothetical protein